MNGSGEVQPQSQFEMPLPQESPPKSGEIKSDQALERGAPDENRVGKQQPPPMPTLPTVATPVVTDDQAAASPDPSAVIPDSGLAAKDTDNIEKQWVQKAKAIIAQNQDDPFIQKNEMSKFKAEYIQKRYNKTIPISEKADG